jgi:asparagine synthase (glutamine-hydrolysing)
MPEELGRMAAELGIAGAGSQEIEISGNAGLVGASSGKSPWSAAVLPLVRGSAQCLLAFDGRIDNRGELQAALHLDLVAGGNSISSEEIVLAAYERWGMHFPEHIVGDFALATWVPRTRTLVCVRDHFGAKPLYYHVSKRSVVFASTPQAVLASGNVQPVINEGRIADFLIEPWPSLGCLDKTSTFYEGIVRLEPAHMLIVNGQEVNKRRYWQPRPATHTVARTDEDAIEGFRERLGEAVRCRLPINSPPASMLSGGLDSSSVVATAREILTKAGGKPLHTFSAITMIPRAGGDTEHIAAVVSQGSLEPHLISPTDLAPHVDELIALMAAEQEPFEWLMNMVRGICMTARTEGMDSLFDGIDGDILILAPYFVRAWLWRHAALPAAIGETLATDGVEAWAASRWALFFNSMKLVLIPDWIRARRRQLRYGAAADWAVRNTIIRPDLAVRTRLGDRWATLDANMSPLGSHSPLEAHTIAINHPGIPARLESVERMSNTFGIEALHPLLDVRLVQFCLSLPWQLQTKHGWTKLIMRRAVEPWLPSQVVWRRTRDALGREFNMLLLRERGAYLWEQVMNERVSLEAYIDFPKLLRIWREYSTHEGERDELQIWHAIALALWLRRQREFSRSLP